MGCGAAMKKPKHVHGYVDRHGKARFYFRRKGCPQISLPGLPWSPEFMAAYHEAMSSDAPRTVIVANNCNISCSGFGHDNNLAVRINLKPRNFNPCFRSLLGNTRQRWFSNPLAQL